MLTLVVERSTCRPGWALFRDAVCQLETVADVEPSRAPDWLARLGEALDAAGVSLAMIDQFAAGLGPGSFSGTRAAVAALQGMALPGGKPLVGLSSAAALAFAVLSQRKARGLHTPVAVVGDARRERLWCAVYALEGECLVVCKNVAGNFIGSFVDEAPDNVPDKDIDNHGKGAGDRPPTHDAADFTLTTDADLPRHLPPDTVVVTPDWERIGARLSALLPAAQLVAMPLLPTAADVGRLLLSDPAAAHAEPLPIYLHPAVAEVRT